MQHYCYESGMNLNLLHSTKQFYHSQKREYKKVFAELINVLTTNQLLKIVPEISALLKLVQSLSNNADFIITKRLDTFKRCSFFSNEVWITKPVNLFICLKSANVLPTFYHVTKIYGYPITIHLFYRKSSFWCARVIDVCNTCS